MIIVRYRDLDRWRQQWGWRLVYGRRKTGKSFFVREFTEWDRYYFVNRGGGIVEIGSKRAMSKREFFAELFALLGRERVVVDEFQRLGDDFVDRLHAEGRLGELTLITSALSYARRILGRRSPLLGLVSSMHMSLVHPLDLLANLADRYVGKELVERAVFAQEPWLIEAATSKDFLDSALSGLSSVPGLVGEIFFEEDRKLTETYEAVLRAVASGKRVSTEVAKFLHSRGLLDIPQPGYVIPYLRNLEALGILWHVTHGKKQYYFHVSPAVDLYYYLTEKYGDSFSKQDVETALGAKMGLYVEDFVRRFFEGSTGLRATKLLSPEIDGVFFRAKRVAMLLEVKWKERVTKKEVREVEEKFSQVERRFGEVERKVLVVPDASAVPETDLDVWDVERMIATAKRQVKEPL